MGTLLRLLSEVILRPTALPPGKRHRIPLDLSLGHPELGTGWPDLCLWRSNVDGEEGLRRKKGEGLRNELATNGAGCVALSLAAATERRREGHLCSNVQQNEMQRPLFSLFLFSFLLSILSFFLF
jgi:hypothetical protein